MDANEELGATVYATIIPYKSQALYAAFLKVSPGGNVPSNPPGPLSIAYLPVLRDTVDASEWKTDVYRWRRQGHISELKASILALSYQWSASKQLAHHNVLWITDCACALGADKKGRSSVPNL